MRWEVIPAKLDVALDESGDYCVPGSLCSPIGSVGQDRCPVNVRLCIQAVKQRAPFPVGEPWFVKSVEQLG